MANSGNWKSLSKFYRISVLALQDCRFLKTQSTVFFEARKDPWKIRVSGIRKISGDSVLLPKLSPRVDHGKAHQGQKGSPKKAR